MAAVTILAPCAGCSQGGRDQCGGWGWCGSRRVGWWWGVAVGGRVRRAAGMRRAGGRGMRDECGARERARQAGGVRRARERGRPEEYGARGRGRREECGARERGKPEEYGA
ncbi:hypothetical protein GCM10011609_37070 [Lentzea pudingi]|uniref:Uncharacterized protein n=2 Tax=Lentzea pudingi TaxID=1789439 RepID=A0ABQ2I1E8_9PSEU|nr:hypothetical protein GCM10011609_37070 [Lentzea pudingi]